MRKVWILGILVAVLIVITVGYIRLVLLMSENRSIYDALPQSSTLVFELNEPENTFQKLSSSNFSEHLFEASFIKKLQDDLMILDSLFYPRSDSLTEKWDQTTLLASLNMTGKEEFDYLYILKKNNFKEEAFQALFSGSKSQFKSKERIFREEQIYEVAFPQLKSSITCAFVNGIFVASFTSFLVEEAIVQLRDKRSLLKDDDFEDITELAGKDADIVIYLNFSNLDLFQPLLVNNAATEVFQSLTAFAGWMELDLKIQDNSFLINGYTTGGSKNNFLSQFKTEPSTNIEATQVVPNNVAIFYYHAIDDFTKFTKRAIDNKIIDPTSALVNNFRNWVGNEWCFGVLEPFDKNFEEEIFLAVKSIDIEITRESLLELARLNDNADFHFDFRGYQINRLTTADTELNELFGHNKTLPVKDPYYTIIQNYVVFANSLSTLKTVIGQFEERQTIAMDPDYIEFDKSLTGTSNFYLYINTSRMIEILNRYVTGSMVKSIRQGDKDFMKFSPIALQFNHYENIFFTNGYVKYSSHIEESTNRVWQTKLDGKPIIPPFFVINHYTQENEIMIQDDQNNVYLITRSGKILWKRHIDGAIMSDIYMMDFYENTKLQFLFNTKDKIYLIDRKGEDVADYPLKLPAEASNGILMVDYDNKKNYRIFVACKNKNIYAFYRSGKPLPGWNPQSGVGIVNYPLKHVLVDRKDYLIAVNEDGKVYFFNRRGELRTKPIDVGETFQTDFHIRVLNNTFQMYNADKKGNIYKVYRNGSYSSQQQNLPTQFFDLQYEDLNNDGKYEFIFIDTLLVKVYNEQYEEIHTTSYAEMIDKPGFIVNYSNGKKKKGLGLVSSKNGKIYLTDENYQFHSAFPLAGCTDFVVDDMFDTGRKVVITGGCDEYLYAYQVK